MVDINSLSTEIEKGLGVTSVPWRVLMMTGRWWFFADEYEVKVYVSSSLPFNNGLELTKLYQEKCSWVRSLFQTEYRKMAWSKVERATFLLGGNRKTAGHVLNAATQNTRYGFHLGKVSHLDFRFRSARMSVQMLSNKICTSSSPNWR